MKLLDNIELDLTNYFEEENVHSEFYQMILDQRYISGKILAGKQCVYIKRKTNRVFVWGNERKGSVFKGRRCSRFHRGKNEISTKFLSIKAICENIERDI